MSEDSSSDEEWRLSTIRHVYNAHPKAKCWECGKKIRNLESLMSHYKSHNIKATCHICKITFRRLTSLSTHLDNAHSPPFCKTCQQSFSNVWELNKHAETHCMGSASFQEASSLISVVKSRRQNSGNFSNEVTAQQSTNSLSELRPGQRIDMKPERPETSGNSVEYIVGEDDKDIDMENDCERTDDSTSSESDDKDKTRSKPHALYPDDSESDDGSDSSSNDDSYNPHTKTTPPSVNVPTNCTVCGRGPFKSIKLHKLHCSGVKVKYQCIQCKKVFLTEASFKEHHMPLYSCHTCGQVFSDRSLYSCHSCPKGSVSPLVFFCPESMPKACNICKLFFTNEKTLLNHVTRIHASLVSTKVCIIKNPSLLTDKKVAPGVHSADVQSAIFTPNVVNQAINGKFRVSQTSAGSLPTLLKVGPSSLLTSFHPGTPTAPLRKVCAAAPVKSSEDGPIDQPTAQLSGYLSTPLSFSPGAASDPDSPPMPTILAMFENGSQKRMNTGWRSKAPHPCRQCGAILRQPSLIISHRYLHRGHRSYRCQCGRAFKHQLHLLRHCVQHAEAISYICASCGGTFTGAKLLAQHLKGKSLKKSRSARRSKAKGKCKMPFTCDCGQLFFRPSAYIWHQLKNRSKSTQLKKLMK